jgi:hypothetical protein
MVLPFASLFRGLSLLAIAAIVGMTSTLQAQVVRYDTRAAYNLATTNNTIITFDGLGLSSGTMYPSGLTISGTTFTGINGATAETIDATVFGVSGEGLLLGANNGQFNTDSLLITLPANTFAFGTEFKGAGSFIPEPYTFTLYSGANVLGVPEAKLAESGTAYSFIGFSSLTDPITSVRIQVTGAIGSPEPIVDNVTFSAVPEPATWVVCVGATMLTALTHLRRRRSWKLEVRSRQGQGREVWPRDRLSYGAKSASEL